MFIKPRLPHNLSLLMIVFVIFVFTSIAADLPTNPLVQHGTVTHSTTGNIMDIVQTTPASITNYDDFSVGVDHTVNINQPNANSGFLGRVTGSSISNILGNLSSNGAVYLVNPSGIIFGANSIVNVHKLVASTLNIADDDFINGRDEFDVVGNIVVSASANTISQGASVSVVTGGSFSLTVDLIATLRNGRVPNFLQTRLNSIPTKLSTSEKHARKSNRVDVDKVITTNLSTRSSSRPFSPPFKIDIDF